MCPKKDGDARTSINVKRCNSTTKVQYMYTQYSTQKTERHINQTPVQKKHRKKKRKGKKDKDQIQRYSARTIKITTFTI